MTDHSQKPDPEDWQPATSQPGELYTFEGQMKAYGAFVRNFKRKDPALAEYKRSMSRTGLEFLGIGAAVIVLSILASLL